MYTIEVMSESLTQVRNLMCDHMFNLCEGL